MTTLRLVYLVAVGRAGEKDGITVTGAAAAGVLWRWGFYHA
jgi:hypothetical protein